jgi:hypothetical protein
MKNTLLPCKVLCLLLMFGCSDKPVQLNDAIKTGSLAQVGFAPKRIKQLLDKDYKELHSLLLYKDGY